MKSTTDTLAALRGRRLADELYAAPGLERLRELAALDAPAIAANDAAELAAGDVLEDEIDWGVGGLDPRPDIPIDHGMRAAVARVAELGRQLEKARAVRLRMAQAIRAARRDGQS